jgi:hypothetical protein
MEANYLGRVAAEVTRLKLKIGKRKLSEPFQQNDSREKAQNSQKRKDTFYSALFVPFCGRIVT